MTKTLNLEKIAKLVNGKIIEGDKNIPISQIAPIKEAKKGDISFIFDKKELKKISESQICASCVVLPNKFVPEDIKTISIPKIIVENPKLAFAKLLNIFIPSTIPVKGIHPSAIISKDAKIGKGVSIGAYVVIEDEVKIEDEVVIYPLTYIGNKVVIGEESILYPKVTVNEKVRIGKRVIIHSNTVIGSDGFGYVKSGNIHHKIPQKGEVIIEDDVEIGACVSVDRATIGATIIGRGTKIDNLVQIGHNVKIGKNCIIVAQVGISGSVTIEDNVTLAGQVGVSDHVIIKENTIVAARGVVIKDIGPNLIASGFPAHSHQEELKIKALTHKLPELVNKVKELEKKVEELSARF
ncbi:MAG: UDP-3-O-(3-hydroxymyristoyl)glucosamine N-acyltransferase [bacterium]